MRRHVGESRNSLPLEHLVTAGRPQKAPARGSRHHQRLRETQPEQAPPVQHGLEDKQGYPPHRFR
jgi:hypothetical protein